MPDNLSPEDRRKTMRAVRSKGTRLESRLFHLLARSGIRGWKQHPVDLTGHPDVVFPVQRLVIFVDGCFWHGCVVCRRPLPTTNAEYWAGKIQGNTKRASRVDSQLKEAGWLVLHIWEHELKDLAGRQLVVHRLRMVLAKGVLR